MKTLEQYLRDAMHAGIHWPDHALRTTVHDSYVSFYIHPSGVNGETLNFNVYGNDVRPWEVEGADPGEAARPREFPMVTDDRNSIDTIEELEAYREKGYFQAMGFYPAASNNKRNVVAPEEDRDINGIRRRNHLDRLTPLETQAWKLLQAVEDAGCHPLLTDASVMILALRNKLADWVDEGSSPGRATRDDKVRKERLMNTGLLQSMDARDWAAVFVELVGVNPSIATDADTMTGWFANALMCGCDEGKRREGRGEALDDAAIREHEAHHFSHSCGKGHPQIGYHVADGEDWCPICGPEDSPLAGEDPLTDVVMDVALDPDSAPIQIRRAVDAALKAARQS